MSGNGNFLTVVQLLLYGSVPSVSGSPKYLVTTLSEKEQDFMVFMFLNGRIYFWKT